jgi:hypothetical protein
VVAVPPVPPSTMMTPSSSRTTAPALAGRWRWPEGPCPRSAVCARTG